MTDKQIIKLKPMEGSNEKIIKEKGNTKCIFYSDDICRKGDKTRDCINCARVEYHSLYSLNWDNQERLQKIIKQKEQECEVLALDARVADNHLQHRIEMCDLLGEKLKAKEQECEELKKIINEAKNSNLDLKSFLVGEAVQNEYEQQLDQLKAYIKEDLVPHAKLYKQTLTEIKEIAENVQSFVGRIDIEDDVCEQMEQILQKISECEVKNE